MTQNETCCLKKKKKRVTQTAVVVTIVVMPWIRIHLIASIKFGLVKKQNTLKCNHLHKLHLSHAFSNFTLF